MYRHHNDRLGLGVVVIYIREQRGLLQEAVEVALGVFLAVAAYVVSKLRQIRHTLLIFFGLVSERERIARLVKYNAEQIGKRHNLHLLAERVDKLAERHEL